MKTFKPKFYEIVYWFIPENSDDLFIDVKCLDDYRTSEHCDNRHCYEEIIAGISRFEKNVFLFDVKACEFLQEDNK